MFNYTYEVFFRKFGVRLTSQLRSPILAKLELLELPRNSLLHYVGEGTADEGPHSTDMVFRNVRRPVPVLSLLKITEAIGNPIPVAASIQAAVRNYHSANRLFRMARDTEILFKDPLVPGVFNYAFLGQLYRYARNIYSTYNRWWNINATMWKQAAETAAESDRHQFLIVNLPKTLPSIGELRLASVQLNTQTIKTFNTPEMFFVLELWKWLGEDREKSLLSFMPEEHLNKMNLIIQQSGKFSVVNLGVLNSWRAPSKTELEKNPELKKKGFAPRVMQQYVLYMLMMVFQLKSVDANELLEEGEKTEQVASADEVEAKKLADTAAGVVPDEMKPTQTADDIGTVDTVEDSIESDLAQLEKMAQADANENAVKQLTTDEPGTPEIGVKAVTDRLANLGMISAADYRRYNELSESYKRIPAPDGNGTLADFIVIPPGALELKESPKLKKVAGVLDDTMLGCSLTELDTKYIQQYLQKDIAAAVLAVQQSGVCVTGYDVERVDQVTGSFYSYTVNLAPVEGKPSVFHFKLPALEEDGTYVSNGVKYRMRKQRGDTPIAKVAPDRVALSSYYGKAFVDRSEKRVNNYSEWLRNKIMAYGLDNENTLVTNIHPANTFDNHFSCPRLYSTLAMGFRTFDIGGFRWSFEHNKRAAEYGEENIKTYEKDGMIVCGAALDGNGVLVMDRSNALYRGVDGNLEPLPNIESMLELSLLSAPVEFAELRIMGKTIPLGVALAYEMGLENLMKFLKVTPRRVPAGGRTNMAEHEYSLVFSDETLVFSRDDQLATMILAGFGEYHRAIRGYSVYEFDKKDVYLNVLESQDLGVRYLRELNLMDQLFVDPITRDLLIEMNEPTTFKGLLIRSGELLLTDNHIDEYDGDWLREKGYERLAGAVYKELVKSIRVHRSRAGKNNLPIDINPYAVWKGISQDGAIMLVEDINPIENLKTIEAVTYSGTDGRNSRTMVKRTRAYHKNDPGVISEATKDSGDVGINIYTSADPQLRSLRGLPKRGKEKQINPTTLLSTSALLSPASDMDDTKRVGFISIQHHHTLACSGYHQSAVRTGYEGLMAQRTSDLFAYSAKDDGKVVSVTDTGMVVEYQDGTQRGIELGRRYGNAAGLTLPHKVITTHRPGDTFKKGDILSYNPGFFEPDILDRKNVVWKSSLLVKAALLESWQTLEDSSAISKWLSGQLLTKASKIRTVVVNFDQSLRRMVKPGDQLESEDILCIIEDAVSANNNLIDESSLDTLRVLSASTPQAKMKGKVERIEVFYHGDKEDMSASLRTLADTADKELAKRCKATGKKVVTGLVDEGFRIDGDPLTLDTAAIRIYITTDVECLVGDKTVVANQLKTVTGEVMANPVTTETGEEIHLIFGMKSAFDRIVSSPFLIGTTSTLMDLGTVEACKAYRGK